MIGFVEILLKGKSYDWVSAELIKDQITLNTGIILLAMYKIYDDILQKTTSAFFFVLSF